MSDIGSIEDDRVGNSSEKKTEKAVPKCMSWPKKWPVNK